MNKLLAITPNLGTILSEHFSSRQMQFDLKCSVLLEFQSLPIAFTCYNYCFIKFRISMFCYLLQDTIPQIEVIQIKTCLIIVHLEA